MSLATHKEHGQMSRLISVFAGRIRHFVGFVVSSIQPGGTSDTVANSLTDSNIVVGLEGSIVRDNIVQSNLPIRRDQRHSEQ